MNPPYAGGVIDTSDRTWLRAKKTADLKAKPIVNLIVDRTVASKFLIDTLEAKEPIDYGNMFCIGGAGDAWQQTSIALLKKYDVIAIDDDGWMVCSPKPENEIEFFISDYDGYVVGYWGETIDGVENLQRCVFGDTIARQTYDHTDQWVVRERLFKNTYTVLGK